MNERYKIGDLGIVGSCRLCEYGHLTDPKYRRFPEPCNSCLGIVLIDDTLALFWKPAATVNLEVRKVAR